MATTQTAYSHLVDGGVLGGCSTFGKDTLSAAVTQPAAGADDLTLFVAGTEGKYIWVQVTR